MKASLRLAGHVLLAGTLLAVSIAGHAFPVFVEGHSCASGTLALQSDGSMLVALESGAETAPSFSVLKLASDGKRAAGFGDNGIARIPGSSAVHELIPLGDGRVLAVGRKVSRLLADGSVDPSYGTNGSTAELWEFGRPVATVLLPDGGLIAVSSGLLDPAGLYLFVRLSADGQPVNAYAGRDRVAVPLVGEVYAFSQLASGELEIASYTRPLGNERPVVRPEVRRISFSASGEPVMTGLPGQVMPSPGIAAWMSPLAKVDAVGRVVIGYAFNTFTEGGVLARFLPDGTPDVSFGANGSATIPTFSAEEIAQRNGALPREFLKAVWTAPGGGWTVVVDATMGIGLSRGGMFASGKRLLRLTAHGELDPAFPQRRSIPRIPGVLADNGNILQVDGFWQMGTPRRCAIDGVRGVEGRVEGTLVEYYAPDLDHYFMTLEGLEVAILDAHPEMGWKRTGARFGAWAVADVPGAALVCRFYGDPVRGPNSHFYIPEGNGCNGLRQLQALTPLGEPAWRFEGHVFSAREAFGGSCPSTLAPVYRFYNDGFGKGKDPNHRYSVDPSISSAMLARGWVLEGIAFCVPPPSGRGEARSLQQN